MIPIIDEMWKKCYNNYVYKMLKGEQTMIRKRIGFKVNNGVIIKSPKTGIIVKVSKQMNETYLIERISYIQLKEEEKNLDKPMKKKTIIEMVLGYAILTMLFINILGIIMGIVAGMYFIITTVYATYLVFPNIIYAFTHKEEMQYENILRRIEICYRAGKKINEQNLRNIKIMPNICDHEDVINLFYIRHLFVALIYFPCILLASYAEMYILIPIELGIFILCVIAVKNNWMLESLIKLEELLIYRKPTAEQIEMVLFGVKYLKEYERTEQEIWNKYTI